MEKGKQNKIKAARKNRDEKISKKKTVNKSKQRKDDNNDNENQSNDEGDEDGEDVEDSASKNEYKSDEESVKERCRTIFIFILYCC